MRLGKGRAAAAAWHGRSAGAVALRGALLPAAGIFRGIVAVRNRLYDRGTLRARRSPIPVASIGNISVGGAGKTPVTAWLARQLLLNDAAPAVVMRGYGGDEPMVHRELNPDVPVLLYGKRAAGVRAAARIGCDVALLDDAFQHRAAARDEDIVLIAADTWNRSMALLPAGPWREPLTAVRRATLALITVKAAHSHMIEELHAGVSALAPAVPCAIARLRHDSLRALSGESVEALSILRGRRVLGVAAVADPPSFFAQLEKAGATVTRRAYGDHHSYTRGDVAALADAAAAHELMVCTLKDAVKLRSMWPPDAPPAWYVSQTVTIEQGVEEVNALIRRLLAARTVRPSNRDTSAS